MAKAQPGKLNYSAGITGSSPHLAMEMLMEMAGVPVAAFSAPGPVDIIPGSNAGVLAPGQTDGLKEACLACLDLDRVVVRKFARPSLTPAQDIDLLRRSWISGMPSPRLAVPDSDGNSSSGSDQQ